jgi:hypothetical protein
MGWEIRDLWPYPTGAAAAEGAVVKGRLFFRVVERQDGRWACRRGRTELDSHVALAEAVVHMRALASQHRPSEVLFTTVVLRCGTSPRSTDSAKPTSGYLTSA